jgi:hypothetical protein
MNPPLIDLCLYSEKDMSTFLEANPRLKESTRISDARGHHLLFYSDDAKERKIKNGKKRAWLLPLGVAGDDACR